MPTKCKKCQCEHATDQKCKKPAGMLPNAGAGAAVPAPTVTITPPKR